jgi:uncharacterized iron-regulated protein
VNVVHPVPEGRLRRILACIVLLLAAGCVAPGDGMRESIFSPGDAMLSERDLVSALRAADITVLGEVHDNPVHHARQARLVRALRPGGIAFEMVPADSEEGVQVFLAQGGAREELGPAIGWDRLGWPDWSMYAPVFAAAKGAYVAGGGVPRAELRLAAKAGASVAFGRGAGRLGLDMPLDPATRAEIEDEMIAAHCNKLPRDAARGRVEAQRLRDARFAAAAYRALAAGGGKRAVLITGNGHARTDRGVPAYLRRVAPGLRVVSVGMLELAPGADPVAAARGQPFDYVWFAAPAKREDPCAAFD